MLATEPEPQLATRPSDSPDLAAWGELLLLATCGPEALGDRQHDRQAVVCAEALRRLCFGGRVRRAALSVLLWDAAWGGTTRAPGRVELARAQRTLDQVAAEVHAEGQARLRPGACAHA